MKKIKLALATNNEHKLEEILAVIGDKFELNTLKQIGCFDELPETGNTLEANSLQKAQYIWDKFKINCLSDDSGLEVKALNGRPGVDSAQYAGPQRSHEDNMNLLLKNLAYKTNFEAQFRTILTLIIDGKVNQFEGIVTGKIVKTKAGNQGFGYDPIFMADGYDKTFAEMSIAEKNNLSHRARALSKMVEYLVK
jgi:XTP/dITP diphosphohydrolase